ncbi:MAG: hypothetical protein ACI82A_000258 [Candidatus Azotimanducaceae bacterium]|jgi:uncharacterized protein with von Willebrand factor type A (vWA) domain
MLLGFFERLREYQVPVSTREFLDCLNLFQHRVLQFNVDDFYYLSRTSLVKDEKYYDRFDRAFDSFFSGLDDLPALIEQPDVEALVLSLLQSHYPDLPSTSIEQALAEYHQQLDAMRADARAPALEDSLTEQDHHGESDGVDAHAEKFNKDADDGESQSPDREDGEGSEEGKCGEQGERGEEGERGESGKKGEGDDGIEGKGTSDIGEAGEKTNFEKASSRRAQKLWQLRRFEDYDSDVELGTRNLKMALRRVRKFARTGAEMELDLADTIRCTARNAGMLDIKEVPEKHNSIKVLLFLDVGGSMDDHIALCEQLFSAARYEFKYLETYYFHNFIYESVWPDNERRTEAKINTWDMIRKFGSDYKIIFVGDGNMARHEIADRGGSVEHFNAESGEVWMQRIEDQFRKIVWLNPVPEKRWNDSYSTVMIKRIMDDHMYPLSVEGIDQAARYLVR